MKFFLYLFLCGNQIARHLLPSAMPSDTSHHTIARSRELYFEELPAYAQFLLDNKLEEFAAHQLCVSREIKVPLLKYFESMPEDELGKLSIDGTREMLRFFASNNAGEYINKSLESWMKNQLPLVQNDDVIVED